MALLTTNESEQQNVTNHRVIVYGSSATGKTCFLKKLEHGRFSENVETTIGASMYRKAVTVEQRNLHFEFWVRREGEERFQLLRI
jgi:GTPase SAR1 family protein